MRLLTVVPVFALAAAGALQAAPPLTTIRDTIYKADGSRFRGSAVIEWRTFEASDYSVIGKQRIQVPIENGLLDVRLVPTTTATPAAYYWVKFISDGNVQFTEAWAVRPSTTPLLLRDVRVADPILGPQSGQVGQLVTISDVDGLESELNLRPRRGAAFSPGRVVTVAANGELESVAGDPFDCVRVDGSSGPCGTGVGAVVAGTFVDGETPAGAINGVNAVFTLAQMPNPAASLLLYRNGVLQKRQLDYTTQGSTIEFLPVSIPQPGDVIQASYRTTGTGGTLPQLLCTGVGASTSQTALTSLGACSVPANLLRSGDRVEILFDYSHQGTASAYQVEVLWGATVLALTSGGATTALLTGRGGAGLDQTAAQLSALVWGAGSAPVTSAATATDNVAAGFTIDFRARLTTASADSVSLRNYTVVRYPAP